MPDEYVKADAGVRKIVIVIFAVAVLLAALLVVKALPWFQGYIRSLQPDEALGTLKAVLAVLFLSVIPAGVYIFWLGRRVARDGRFPPGGMKVIKDTRIVTGRKARVRGNILMLFAGTLIVLGLIGAVYAWISVDQIIQVRL